MSKKVIVFQGFPKSGQEVLESNGLICQRINDLDPDILLREARDCVAPILGLGKWTRAVADQAPLSKVVSRFGVGYDTVDVQALTEKKIPLCVTGIANSVTVAELAMQLMMTVLKRHRQIDDQVRKGSWSRPFPVIHDLAGKTVLVSGFGRIGTRVASRCKAFEMNVLVNDPFIADSVILAAGYTPAPDLKSALPKADIVTLHMPKSPATENLISRAEIAMMKDGAVLINTARGGIVDEDALVEGLRSGKLFGCGLDVMAQEPPPVDHPLFDPSLNVALSPHFGAATVECLNRMAVTSAQNVVDVINGKPDLSMVINPEVL